MATAQVHSPLSWRSRTFRCTAGLLLLVLLTRLLWGWASHRQLESRLSDLRRQGFPVAASDVRIPPLPDAQNAWHYQVAAINAIVPGVDCPAASNLEYPDYPPFPHDWWQLAQASERAHQRAFALARQARQFPRAQLRTGVGSPVFSSVGGIPFSGARNLANTVADGALYAHLTGHDPEALDRAADLLHLAGSLRQDPLLVSQLVGVGIDALACDRLQAIAPGLHLDHPADDPTRERARALIATLLDESAARQCLVESVRFEQLAVIDATQWVAQPTWVIRPLADRQVLRDIDNFRLATRAATRPTRPEVRSVLTAAHADTTANPNALPRYSRWFNVYGSGYLDRYFETVFRVIAERRATAVSLAARLYRADHAGRWPVRLDDLAPDYLSAVPRDPFHDDGRALGYVVLRLPDGTPRPLVYFDAGDATDGVILPTPLYSWQIDRNNPRRDIRQYRDLSRFTPPPPPPSTKAVDDNP